MIFLKPLTVTLDILAREKVEICEEKTTNPQNFERANTAKIGLKSAKSHKIKWWQVTLNVASHRYKEKFFPQTIPPRVKFLSLSPDSVKEGWAWWFFNPPDGLLMHDPPVLGFFALVLSALVLSIKKDFYPFLFKCEKITTWIVGELCAVFGKILSIFYL